MPVDGRPLHVALWVPAWPLVGRHNGIVTYVHWLKLGLENLGHRVSMLTGDVEGAFPEVTRVTASRWQRLRARLIHQSDEVRLLGFGRIIAGAALEIHRRTPIDVIEMEESFGWCEHVAKLTSIPTVVKLHGPAFLSMVSPELESPFGRLKIEREGEALRTIQTITSPSSSTLSRTIDRYGLAAPRMRYIANPLGEDSEPPLWSLDRCEQQTILFVGRFDLRKGGDLVIRAFTALALTYRNLKLLFVGPDYGIGSEDGKQIYFGQFLERIVPATYRNQVQYLGVQPAHEIRQLRQLAMVTLIASRWENLPYTLLEAMLQGCPVVSSDAGGCPEVVTHDVNGKLAMSGSPQSFAEQIAALIDHPSEAQALGGAARRHVLENYSAAAVARKTLDLYRQIAV